MTANRLIFISVTNKLSFKNKWPEILILSQKRYEPIIQMSNNANNMHREQWLNGTHFIEAILLICSISIMDVKEINIPVRKWKTENENIQLEFILRCK